LLTDPRPEGNASAPAALARRLAAEIGAGGVLDFDDLAP
jgi:hypothetical protein